MASDQCAVKRGQEAAEVVFAEKGKVCPPWKKPKKIVTWALTANCFLFPVFLSKFWLLWVTSSLESYDSSLFKYFSSCKIESFSKTFGQWNFAWIVRQASSQRSEGATDRSSRVLLYLLFMTAIIVHKSICKWQLFFSVRSAKPFPLSFSKWSLSDSFQRSLLVFLWVHHFFNFTQPFSSPFNFLLRYFVNCDPFQALIVILALLIIVFFWIFR